MKIMFWFLWSLALIGFSAVIIGADAQNRSNSVVLSSVLSGNNGPLPYSTRNGSDGIPLPSSAKTQALLESSIPSLPLRVLPPRIYNFRFGRYQVLSAPAVKKDLYPANANASEEIDLAIKKASAHQKKILLIFGGNWCYDCHVLDRALHEGAAGDIVKASYLLVHVDIGEGDPLKNQDLIAKYQIPIEKGVPAVVVLKDDGSVIYSSGNGEFESARTMMTKDLVAFLKHWQN